MKVQNGLQPPGRGAALARPPLVMVITSIVLMLATADSRASIAAHDDAGNYTTWSDTTNRGFGFPAGFTFSHGSNSGFFLGSSDINSSNGKSWGFYANSGDTSSATRFFSGAMSIGQTFSLKMDNGSVDSGSGQNVGFDLVDSGSSTVFNFRFLGGTTYYSYFANGSRMDTTVGFTSAGLRIEFARTTATDYSFKIYTNATNTTAAQTITGSLGLTANSIAGFRLYDNNAGSGSNNDAFFNDVTVPEPAGSAIVLLAALKKLSRRRRR